MGRSAISARDVVLTRVADLVPSNADRAFVRVAVDGPDGSGKTTFANELADVLRAQGRPTIRVSADDFHHPRAIRYQRGRESPEGFWLDSYDYDRLRADVLTPFGPGGSGRYRTASHDLDTDSAIEPEWRQATPGSVLVLDGLFLHRNDLHQTWDFSIYLDVPFAVTAQRMAARNGSHPDPAHPSMRRYVEAQRIYFCTCAPRTLATVVIDNTDVNRPEFVATT